MSQQDIVTIDGPAGSGKSSVSRSVARNLGFTYLDTGAMYRGVAYEAGRLGLDFSDGEALKGFCDRVDLVFELHGDTTRLHIGGKDLSEAIRTPEMDMLSSRISAVPEVREAMTMLQRRMAGGGRIVAEGRDMGTVVFPGADHKFFLTASSEIRAMRRYNERISRGERVSFSHVMRDLERRDKQDESRALAPLRPADDAMIIDTSDMDKDQVVWTIVVAVRTKK